MLSIIYWYDTGDLECRSSHRQRRARGRLKMDATSPKQWLYLAPNPKSHWRQLFVKGTEFLARDLYALYLDEEEPKTPAQVAEAYGVPVEAGHQAIAYCES